MYKQYSELITAKCTGYKINLRPYMYLGLQTLLEYVPMYCKTYCLSYTITTTDASDGNSVFRLFICLYCVDRFKTMAQSFNYNMLKRNIVKNHQIQYTSNVKATYCRSAQN